MPSVKSEAKRYAHLGFSVLPVRADKRPLGRWKAAQRDVADDRTIDGWYHRNPTAGVAIVCGQVSGGLVVLDVDHRAVSDWLQEHAQPLLSSTWAVRTGSGKLHIYLRSQEVVYTTKVSAPDGVRLAEIRSDGRPPHEASYVVAPPSPYDFSGVQGYYETLGGSPESVATVRNASTVFESVLERSYARLTGNSAPLPPSSNSATTDVAAPGDGERLLREIRKRGISGKVQRAIIHGGEPGVGDWWACPSHSEIDYLVISALREKGMDLDTIEGIFATFPVGEACYRNRSRPNHGRRYLTTTIDKIDQREKDRKAAAQVTAGKNFQIVRIVRIEYDPTPIYELHMELDSGRAGIVRLNAAQLASEHQFRVACLNGANFHPELKDSQVGHYGDFVTAVAKLAETETPPEDATDTGHLTGIVLQILRYELSSTPLDDPKTAVLGWRDDSKGVVYVVGRALVQRVGQIQRPSPSPNKIWEVLRAVGGTDDGEIVGNGQVRTWRVPVRPIDVRG